MSLNYVVGDVETKSIKLLSEGDIVLVTPDVFDSLTVRLKLVNVSTIKKLKVIVDENGVEDNLKDYIFVKKNSSATVTERSGDYLELMFTTFEKLPSRIELKHKTCKIVFGSNPRFNEVIVLSQ